jgi:hypothetical protein
MFATFIYEKAGERLFRQRVTRQALKWRDENS